MVILSSFQLKTWKSSPRSTISDDPLSDDTEQKEKQELQYGMLL